MIETLSTSELCAIASHARAALENPHANDYVRAKWLKLIEQIDQAILGRCEAQNSQPPGRFPDGEFFFCSGTCPATWTKDKLGGLIALFPNMGLISFQSDGDEAYFAVTSKHSDHSDHFFELGKIVGRLEEREK